ncbi:MAG: amidohydrolase [Peptococcaceae bacterium]|nr:amidohydrolase [Peptococcaceae bacterium]
MKYMEATAFAKLIEQDLVKWRRNFHQIPETGLNLPLTRAYLKDELLSLGPRCRVVELKAGILVEIEPVDQVNAKRTPFLLRFDMDALPVQEETELDFSSRFQGYMHACGHDGHAAVGLGLAKILTANPGIQQGRVRIAFQAGEETLEGARLLVAEIDSWQGLQGPAPLTPAEPGREIALAMHLDPQLPRGVIAIKSGQLNARVDNLRVIFKGKPGHGAYPHLCADPVVAMASFVTAAQTIISRNLSPAQPAVLSFGKVAGGNVPNVIPEEIVLEGTLRSGGQDTASLVSSRLAQISAGIGQTYGVSVRTEIEEKCPAVLCDPDLAQWAKEILQTELPENIVSFDRILMGGDDFAFFSQVMPALMFRIGAGSEKKDIVYPLHSNRFNFDEKILVMAVAIFLNLITSNPENKEI